MQAVEDEHCVRCSILWKDQAMEILEGFDVKNDNWDLSCSPGECCRIYKVGETWWDVLGCVAGCAAVFKCDE